MRVLIVDDHAGFRQQARALLEAAGYEVVGEAATGAEAVVAAAALDPELVLLDVQLPDFDGFEVGAALQGVEPARGFVPKAELSGGAIAHVLDDPT